MADTSTERIDSTWGNWARQLGLDLLEEFANRHRKALAGAVVTLLLSGPAAAWRLVSDEDIERYSSATPHQATGSLDVWVQQVTCVATSSPSKLCTVTLNATNTSNATPMPPTTATLHARAETFERLKSNGGTLDEKRIYSGNSERVTVVFDMPKARQPTALTLQQRGGELVRFELQPELEGY